MTLGIIGFGRIGRLLVRYWAKDFSIYVFEPKSRDKEILAMGGIASSLEEVCRQDVVIVCVPIRDFEKVLRLMEGHLGAGALVMDVCSVKEYPVRLMRQILPKSTEILATHPTFGPDSAAQSLKGQKIVLCKVRIGARRYARIKNIFKGKGLEVVEMSPKAHDREMAATLVLTHFIGRSLIGFGARRRAIETEGYKRLMHILQTVQNDSWELFEDMNKYNAFAGKVREKFIESLKAINGKLLPYRPGGVLSRSSRLERSREAK